MRRCAWLIGLAGLVCSLEGVAQVPCAAASSSYDVAAYVWPAYQPEPRWAELGIFKAGRGEWQNVWEAVPKWPGHDQPLRPLWGYENEADPHVMEKKIDAAVAHGVNVFIYDWYWYGGRPFLEDALNKGFLGACNCAKMKFFIMWANHDVNEGWNNRIADKDCHGWLWRGSVKSDEFRRVVVPRWIAQYFRQPNYYRIEGKPVLMIYDVSNLIAGFGGLPEAVREVAYVRTACEQAGLGGVHLMACDFHLKPEWIKALGIGSATQYNFVHWASPKGNPDYAVWAENAVQRFASGARELGVKSYFAHASVGWDQNPRFPREKATATVTGSSPEKFAAALRRAKAWCDRHTPAGYPRLITVNSWNEWTEGSYLEPDATHGYGYLNAVKSVLGGK